MTFFLNRQLIHLEGKRYEDVEDIKRNMMEQLYIISNQKWNFKGALTNAKLNGINV